MAHTVVPQDIYIYICGGFERLRVIFLRRMVVLYLPGTGLCLADDLCSGWYYQYALHHSVKHSNQPLVASLQTLVSAEIVKIHFPS